MLGKHTNVNNDDDAKPGLVTKIKTQFKAILLQNVTPSKLSLSLSMGLTIGLFPLPGFTFLLCGLLAWIFKLNQPAIQFVNFVVTPLEIACIPLFVYFGELIMRRDEHFSLNPAAFVASMKADFWAGLAEFGGAVVDALIGWIVFLPFGTVILWVALTPVLTKVLANMNTQQK
jgi:uncharacterized protein (DUF2062 family)